MATYNESAFEASIEAHLLANGWMRGAAKNFDRTRAFDRSFVTLFISETQPELWADLRKQHKDGLDDAVIDTLEKALDSQGTLSVLRHGFKFFGKLLRVAYFKPAHDLNPDVLRNYTRNRLIVTRQVKFDPDSEVSADTILSINGLPVVTVELKNPLTGQNVEHAVTQYKERDAKLPLFRFKQRALVHFAVDPDLAYMTTRLAGKDTYFLPFNRGHANGAGNPEHPSGYRTGYLWQEVWQRDSFLDIVGRFMHLTVEEKQVAGKKITKETVIFPRYHQLDAVRKLEAAARTEGPGNNYLIQHSAGSGKSNSIAWLAYRLSELHTENKKTFHSVVVVTDRRVLDTQLQTTIYQFEHKNGVVARIDEHSDQLAEALNTGTPIIITTLQKFPYVAKKVGEFGDRAYAVIVDEAHSSQGGEAATKMRGVLRAKDLIAAATEDADDTGEDAEDELRKVMESRGRQPNLSFFAFTATPKAKTLEVFGRRGSDGKPYPFHLYSMRQAIEEGFILDVLKTYTTYKSYWRLVNAKGEDPTVPKAQATVQLARFVSLHPHNISQKTEVMVEHFRAKVKHKLGGRAKAMVVTSSRLHAVRYKRAFETYIKEKGYTDIGVLVAFSGEVEDPDLPGVTETEVGMNGGKISEKALPDAFDTDEYRVLLVANKFQTGFDQPLLHTMYVDKRLSGVQAVQTLSRLNRTAPGKEDTFVLDFVNDAEEVRRSFQPYYEQATVSETAEPAQLYDLQHKLDATQVYFQSEVDAFCKVFYAPKEKQSVADNAEMYRHLTPAVDRFKALDVEKQDEFRGHLSAYVRLYSFLSQVMPFADPDLEKLYTFGRFLELKLPVDPRKAPLKLDADVALAFYRLDRISEGRIALEKGEAVGLKGPTDVGTRKAEDKQVKLSEIIDVLNERFGTEFTKADALFFESVIEQAKEDEDVQKRAAANLYDNFALSMKDKLRDAIIDRIEQNSTIVSKYMNEADFQRVAFDALARRIYDDLRGSETVVRSPRSAEARARDLAAADARIAQLRSLRTGWFNGEGQSLNRHGLDWAHGLIRTLIERYGLPKPQLAPTPEGHLVAEWSREGKEIGIDFNLLARTADLSSVGADSGAGVHQEWTPDAVDGIGAVAAFVQTALSEAA
jgi:type I restriction enzyme R subunit